MYSDALIGARIKTIFDDEHGLYGAKRIAASLKADTGFGPINHKKVARVMKAMGLKGFTKRRRCITTRRKPGHRVMPDLVGRKFTADEPNGDADVLLDTFNLTLPQPCDNARYSY
ncbi:IS3 family transposase, partial [Corynebacterium belfantii]